MNKHGMFVAILHTLIFGLFIFYLYFVVDDAQSRLLWVLWVPIDFPVSLLVGLGLDFIPSNHVIGSTIRFFLPHIVHGVIGPIWWYFLISFITVQIKKRIDKAIRKK